MLKFQSSDEISSCSFSFPYKRSLSAPWEKRAEIIPINKWKDGVGKAINFSYFSPYDVVTKPIEAIFKQWQEGTLDKNTVGQKLLSQAIDQDGPLRTLLDPFLTQSIALERFTDVLPAELGIGNRGGVTKTGAKVYSDTDSDGEKISGEWKENKEWNITKYDANEKIIANLFGDLNFLLYIEHVQ